MSSEGGPAFDYDGRRFVSVSNTGNGEAGEGTAFLYRQESGIVWATYTGGAVEFGTLVGKVDSGGALRFVYQHLNDRGEFMTGECQSRLEVLPEDGRYRLHESWRWTSGDHSSGRSVIEEIR